MQVRYGGGRGLRAFVRSHPRAADGVLVLLLVLFSLPHDTVTFHLSPALIGLDLALTLPLLWRRRAPVAVFATMAAVAFVQWLLNQPLFADQGLLVALYSVAVYRPRRSALAAAAVLEVGVVLAAIRFTPPGLSWLVPLLLLTGSALAAYVTGVDIATRRAYLAALEDRAARLERERDQQGQLAAAAERARIAGELHDIVAHHVSVMVTLADGAAFAALDSPASAAAAMEQVSGTGRQALAEMRRLVGVLRLDGPEPELAPQPGIDQLGQLLERMRATGLPVRLEVSGAPLPLPPSAQLAIYRVVQEALTNTLTHARTPTGARVAVRYGADAVDVEVTDDGLDATSGGDEAPRGYGIAGMRERAGVVGGTLVAGRRTGGGWSVALHIDVDAADSLARRAGVQ